MEPCPTESQPAYAWRVSPEQAPKNSGWASSRRTGSRALGRMAFFVWREEAPYPSLPLWPGSCVQGGGSKISLHAAESRDQGFLAFCLGFTLVSS